MAEGVLIVDSSPTRSSGEQSSHSSSGKEGVTEVRLPIFATGHVDWDYKNSLFYSQLYFALLKPHKLAFININHVKIYQ